ncbi:MAG: sugar-binding transcriptional regulator [Chloroflexota bacterium]
MPRVEELRLITRVARLYYQQELRQSEIAELLGMSQASISRLLNSARSEGVVRISVNVPSGVYSDLEEQLTARYQLKEAIVVDCASSGAEDDDLMLQRDIGAAAAYYVETTIKNNEVVGISSWSSTLLAVVDAMHQVPGKTGIQVVQILGGIGNPSAEVHANRLTGRFASLVNGMAYFLSAPGIVGSEAALRVLMEEAYVRETMDRFEQVTMALVGIGAIEPSKLLSLSGNVFTQDEQDMLRQSGAVGDILLRFFDAAGCLVSSPLRKRVVSMSLQQLRKAQRAIAVAGGWRKYEAIRAALRGGWINVLVTDRCTAEQLVSEAVLPAESVPISPG